MTRKTHDYRKRLFGLALTLGATTALPCAAHGSTASASAPTLGEGAGTKLGEIAASVVADGEDRLTTAAPWDNAAWPESTWTQIIIPPKFPVPGGIADEPAEREPLASILDDLS